MNERHDMSDLTVGVVTSMFAAMRDVHFVNIRRLTSVTKGTRAHSTHRMTFRGWGPSLHEVDMTRRMTFEHAVDEAPRGEQVVSAIAEVLDGQRQRASDGWKIGKTSPMTTCSQPATGHLLVDRTLCDMLVANEWLPTDMLRTALGSMITGDDALECGPVATDHNVVVAETDRGRVIGLVETIAAEPGRWTTFDGHEIHIAGRTVPEVAMAALAGKPLRMLGEVHPGLDDRIVLEVRQDGDHENPGLIVRVEPDLMTMAEVARYELAEKYGVSP